MNRIQREKAKTKEIEVIKNIGASSEARVEKRFIDIFMQLNRSSAIPLKILFYIARINYKTNHTFAVDSRNRQVVNIEIDTKDLCKYCNINTTQLQNGLKKIKDTVIDAYIEDEDTYEWISIIPAGVYVKGKHKLTITMFLYVIYMIKNVSEQYVNIDVDNMMKLNNANTLKMIQILELIDGYKAPAKKQKTMSLDELNGYFGTKYRSCYLLESKLLTKVKNELDQNSKLTFEYEKYFDQAVKKGRPKQLGFKVVLVNNTKRQQVMF